MLLVDGMKPDVCFLRKSKGSFFDLNYRKGRRWRQDVLYSWKEIVLSLQSSRHSPSLLLFFSPVTAKLLQDAMDRTTTSYVAYIYVPLCL